MMISCLVGTYLPFVINRKKGIGIRFTHFGQFLHGNTFYVLPVPSTSDVKWGGSDRFKASHELFAIVTVQSSKLSGPSRLWFTVQDLPNRLMTVLNREWWSIFFSEFYIFKILKIIKGVKLTWFIKVRDGSGSIYVKSMR